MTSTTPNPAATRGEPPPDPVRGTRLDITAGDDFDLFGDDEREPDTVVLRAADPAAPPAAGLAPEALLPTASASMAPATRSAPARAPAPTPVPVGAQVGLTTMPVALDSVPSTFGMPSRRSAPAPMPVFLAPPVKTEAPPPVGVDPSPRRKKSRRASAPAAPGVARRLPPMPFIGGFAVSVQQRILAVLVVVGLVGLVAMTVLTVQQAQRAATHSTLASQAWMHSQRLAKAVVRAMGGDAKAFDDVQSSADVLGRSVRTLRSGSDSAPAVSGEAQALLTPVLPLVERADRNAALVLGERARLLQTVERQRLIERQSADLQEAAEALQSLKVQQGAPASEVAAVGQLVMLTQRIPRSATSLLDPNAPGQPLMVALGRDLSVFRDLLLALTNGNSELRIGPPRDNLSRERLQVLRRQHDAVVDAAQAVLGNLQPLTAAYQAQTAILDDAEALNRGLQAVTRELAGESGLSRVGIALALGAALILLLGVLGFLRLYVGQQAERAALADEQRRDALRQQAEAERQQAEAKRTNDLTQAAILRLMDELQEVAEGDLTRQATVNEDITGAIADSVNYTVEELRRLVEQVQGTATRVTDTTQQVETTSIELLAASSEQLREIRDTGEAVLQMAGRINQVSAQAQQTAEVARQSLAAAESGRRAVQNTIGGMHAIRDQIQDTSKRIKRLGESSQEIGEITELISDLTEQTNVLALNAAIQAASAGEAGRGFSVVAEEVQRLAERSADATRQIAALVRTIQTDTQDAVGAMERSTQGVVEGTRLSDAAGSALGDIDRVSRRLAELIAEISRQALKEAESANLVATNIQHIFAVTEQTGEGTRSTAHMVRELSQTADELRQSVARFKIA